MVFSSDTWLESSRSKIRSLSKQLLAPNLKADLAVAAKLAGDCIFASSEMRNAGDPVTELASVQSSIEMECPFSEHPRILYHILIYESDITYYCICNVILYSFVFITFYLY